MSRLPGSLAELAEYQRGVITRQQALAAGLASSAICYRVSSGRWQRLYPGVLAVFSGEPGRATLLWAAVLRAGPAAALSHQTAAELNGLTRKTAGLIHVTVPSARRVEPAPGLVIHRSARVLAARHPSQTPPRTRIEETVLDLSHAARTFDEALGWLSAACGGRLTTPRRIADAMSQRARQRYREAIRLALDDVADGAHTVLEYRYLHNVERPHGLPRAERQVRVVRGVRTAYLDSLYRRYLVVVETDGRVAHPAEGRWNDVHRDNAAATEGIITLRYNWSDVTTGPCAVAAEVGAVLAKRGWPGPLRRCGPRCAIARRIRPS
ncbi:MAG: type IV toxin-antitoxin system AbiEi family antitoxin domain-containing protein [Streptosporangiaceae bacterium]